MLRGKGKSGEGVKAIDRISPREYEIFDRNDSAVVPHFYMVGVFPGNRKHMNGCRT